MTPKCNTCNHRHLCKFEGEYMQTFQKLSVDVPDPFSLELSCKHYYSTSCTLNDWYNQSDSNSTNNRTPIGLGDIMYYNMDDTIRGDTDDKN